ncbi:hypothetical protein [Algoriphagus sp. A40]|uniref:hypothetical protein n=1 Tax=Algoriphagus sp. A40 TaxID=1945863 RepID=UPI0009844978|nr:hypothetical protein [Algoriphagus sp. A40]OOG72784.1 hypothetical protein B0E43_15085 [Algoriphagus sp. A40]
MKFFLASAVLLLSTAFIPLKKEKVFNQDVAIIHDSKKDLPEGSIDRIQLINGVPVAESKGSFFEFNGERWTSSKNKISKPTLSGIKLPEGSGKVLSSINHLGKVWVGTENGLYRSTSGNNLESVLPADSSYSWSPKDVAALVVDSQGRLWFGAKQGIGRLDEGKWKLFTGAEGLPYNNFTSAFAGPNGEVWFGTKKGAIRVQDDYFYYRFSRRWLPDDHVNDITIDKSGTAWIATNQGISQIASVPMTYEEKAAFFTKQTEDRHVRMGFVAPNNLQVPFEISSYELGISDNDGMYTSMYGAAQAFRYAVTGDPEAKALADRSLVACKWLVDITHESGFPARVIIPIDYREPVNEQYSREYNKRHQQSDPFWKDIYPRFPTSKDGKYMWKCDTSSDELAGHYFFYAVYYDLVAKTEEEKAMVRDVVADITDHLIRNGFMLKDHDGLSTRWGNFSPEYMASVWGWDQRGLNSMMMLSFLNVASHVTGDSKYDEVAKMLRDKYNYHINAMHAKEFFPPDNVVPWDNNLSLMSFYGLINYEKDPELLLMYRESLEYTWLHISKQKNSFWNTIYGALSQKFAEKAQEGFFNPEVVFPENKLYAPQKVKLYSTWDTKSEDIVETLERIPFDLIGYEMDNTHRLDIVLDPTPGQGEGMGWRYDTYAVPVDERGHVRQDRDGFALLYREVGGGTAEQEGTFYLLPYYMARYHQLIEN